MIFRIIERFANSAADALFWILIAFAIGFVISWTYRKVTDEMLKQIPEKEEE